MQRSRPDDFVPPYPAYTSQYPPDQPEFVMAQIGVQSPEAGEGEALFGLIMELAHKPGAGRPQHIERCRHVDRQGYVNEVALAYWKRAGLPALLRIGAGVSKAACPCEQGSRFDTP
jgi:hypothetical protein